MGGAVGGDGAGAGGSPGAVASGAWGVNPDVAYAYAADANGWAEALGLRVPTHSQDLSDAGAMVAAHFRRDWQTERGLVYGVEPDLGTQRERHADWSQSIGFSSIVTHGPAPALPTGMIQTSSLRQVTATLRGRLGYAVGDYLPYLTAGLGVSRLDAESHIAIVGSPSNLSRTLSNSATVFAPVIGGGISWMVSDRVALSSETLYYGFNKDLMLGASETFEIGPNWSTTLKISFKLD